MNANTSEKRAITLIISSLVQTLLFIIVLTMLNMWSSDPSALKGTAWSYILIGMSMAGIVLAILAILGIKDIVRFSQYENDWNVTKAHLQGNQELLETLRAHRHDFINHLQVISGLIQLNKSQKAQEYLTQIVNELNNKKRITFVGSPEIDALLLKKAARAQEMSVAFEVITESEFKGLGIPSYDIARILGNLIENALDACLPLPEEKRHIQVTLREGLGHWEIMVYNQEPIIPQELQARVFEKGYTTKGMTGNGLGLDIVKTLVEKHRGHVMLVSAEGQGTNFTILLPKAF